MHILFSNTEQAIHLDGCQEIASVLSAICINWPFTSIPASSVNSFLRVSRNNSVYELSSPFMNAPKAYLDPVDVACAIIAELAWATLRANPSWLCLHCAAVEIAGRLVLFPNSRRSGKSTLATLLGLRGYRIYTDDFLAIEVDNGGEIFGVSSGVAPRMRRPWPEEFQISLKHQLTQSVIAENHQYSYHAIANHTPVERALRLPIGAIVTLQRDGCHDAELRAADIQETLRTVILQNFSRAINSAEILHVLFAIVSKAELFSLNYSNAEHALALIESKFTKWDGPAPKLTVRGCAQGLMEPDTDIGTTQLDAQDNHLQKAANVAEYSVGDIHFLANPDGTAILQLNQMSAAIWRLLENPIALEEVIQIFCSAFPDEDRETIARDVSGLIKELDECRLLRDEMRVL